jgi:hypothetical protein
MEGVRVELCDCTVTLLMEIANTECKRLSVSKTYALALRSTSPTDWRAVNKAIIDRWSFSALTYIKELAHSGKCFEGTN